MFVSVDVTFDEREKYFDLRLKIFEAKMCHDDFKEILV